MAQRDGNSQKIVIIDDNEVVLAAARERLERAGYTVITHDRPAGCVALILLHRPELVLMDVNMPGLSGDTIVGVFGRSQPHTGTIVLLYSSLSPEALRVKVAASGAHGFIQKSNDPFHLVREVSGWLAKSGTSSSKHQAAWPVPSSERARSSGTLPAGQADEVKEPSAPGLGTAPAPSTDRFANPEARSSATVRVDAPSVLLVDDDMTTLSAYRRVLQGNGLTVEFALSGGQALRRIQSAAPPRAIVMDILLPDTSGIEVYRRATATHPSFAHRFVVSTGASGIKFVADFLREFAGTVLHKPVDPGALRAAINACLQGRTVARAKR